MRVLIMDENFIAAPNEVKPQEDITVQKPQQPTGATVTSPISNDVIPTVNLPQNAPEPVKTVAESDFWKADQRGIVDKILGIFSSRKLLVFVVATIAFFIQFLPAEYWTYIAVAYIGSQMFVDIFAKAGTVGSVVKGGIGAVSSSSSSIPNLFSFGKSNTTSATPVATPETRKDPVTSIIPPNGIGKF
jgi:hypothetical protein